MLVGRAAEQELLSALLARGLERRGAAVLVRGEAGAGKTALLQWLGQQARDAGALVLSCCGVVDEAGLPFAAIADVLRPLGRFLPELAAPQRQAVEVALSLRPGPTAGPLAACIGTLTLLAAAAAEQAPVVVLVDDFQWLDAESAQVLSFVSRRVAEDPLVVVLAAREESDGREPPAGLPTITLDPLTAADCEHLARILDVPVSAAGIEATLDLTGGNPLAVVEFLRTGRGGVWPSTGLPQSLQETWANSWAALPGNTRQVLLLVALDRTAGGHHALRALCGSGLSLADLSPAEQSRLLVREGDTLKLRHPLLRAVVLDRATSEERVAALTALAEVADGLPKLWFLADAATGPDEALAERMVDAAAEARSRNGLAASARTLHRAAELTAGDDVRAMRLLQAARDAFLAGEARTAISWCRQARRLRPDPRFGLQAERVSAAALTWQGDGAGALESLRAAALAVQDVDPAAAVEALAEAALSASMAADRVQVREMALRVEELWRAHPAIRATASQDTVVCVGLAFAYVGMPAQARQYVEHLFQTDQGLPGSVRTGCYVASAYLWCEAVEQAQAWATRTVRQAREAASPPLIAAALAACADVCWWSGDWALAQAEAKEAIGWAVEAGQVGLEAYSRTTLARLDAGCGRADAIDALSRRIAAGNPVLPPPTLEHLAQARGLLALGRGDRDTVVEATWPLFVQMRDLGLGNPVISPWAGDLAEALARAGGRRAAVCSQVLQWLDERAVTTGLAYPLVVAERARGVLAASAEDAEAHFAWALAAASPSVMPFERARTLLALGEARRRARRQVAAREPLRHALTLFERLGARPWAQRATAELRAAGSPAAAPSRPRPSGGGDLLTPQELQVARAVAQGLSNTEVAAALFVSPKTVEAHLTRAYRKLGVKSRTGLIAALRTEVLTD